MVFAGITALNNSLHLRDRWKSWKTKRAIDEDIAILELHQEARENPQKKIESKITSGVTPHGEKILCALAKATEALDINDISKLIGVRFQDCVREVNKLVDENLIINRHPKGRAAYDLTEIGNKVLSARTQQESDSIKNGNRQLEQRYERELSPIFNFGSAPQKDNEITVACYQTRVDISITHAEPLGSFDVTIPAKTYYDENDINEPCFIVFRNYGDKQLRELPFRVFFIDCNGDRRSVVYRIEGTRFRVEGV